MLILAKLFKALNSDASPWQLALGVMFGMIIGLTPFLRLHTFIILFIVLFFRVNLGTFLLSMGVFGVLAFALEPMMAGIGDSLLGSPDLQATWTALYNTLPGQLSQFFHNLTLGGLLFSLTLSPVVLIASKFLIEKYREHLMAWVNKLRLVKFLKGTRWFSVYQQLGG